MDSLPRADDPQDQQRPDATSSSQALHKSEAQLPAQRCNERACEPAPLQNQPGPDEAGSRDPAGPCPVSPDLWGDEPAANDQALSAGADGVPPAGVVLAAAWGDAADPPADRPHHARAKLGQPTAVPQAAALGLVPQYLVNAMGGDRPGGMSSQIDRVADAAGAPRDRPRFVPVLTTIAAAVKELAQDVQEVCRLEAKLLSFVPLAQGTISKGATRNALSKRRGRHLFFALLSDLSVYIAEGRQVDPLGMQIIGAWFVRSLLTGWAPAPEPVAKVRAILVRPDSATAKTWGQRGRKRCLALALTSLQDCIVKNARLASEFDIEVEDVPAETELDLIDHFNLLFRKRLNALRTSSTRRAAAGAGGHETLTENSVAECGRVLLNQVAARDPLGVRRYLQVITHLSQVVVGLLPIIEGADDHPKALAWLSLRTGCYCYRLYTLEERGAEQPNAQSDLFEETEQVVRLRLSPIAVEMLRWYHSSRAKPALTVGELLPEPKDTARSDVIGQHAYRRTPRRIQESLPVLLLARGGNRWPILLATSSPFLSSIGRESYGAVPLQLVQAEFDEAHRLLGFPTGGGTSKGCLIGSKVVPTAETVTTMFDALARQADRDWRGLDDVGSVKRSLRAIAPWVSCLQALCLALRMRLVYRVSRSGQLLDVEVSFDDKHVHPLDPYAVPVPSLLRSAALGYSRLMNRAIEVLRASRDAESQQLAAGLTSFLDPLSTALVVDIDAAGRPVPAGYQTWFDATPSTLRPTGNFARQFWPLQALRMGLPQRLLDVLMRHQLADLHLGGGRSVAIKRNVREALVKVLDRVIEELDLQLPVCLKGFL